MTLLAFVAGVCGVVGVYSLLTDLFLRDRIRFSRRLEETLRTRERDKSQRAPLFKDFEELKARTGAEDRLAAGWGQRLTIMVEQSGLNVTPNRLLAMAAIVGPGLGMIAGLLWQSLPTGVIVAVIGACGPLLYV